MAIDIYCEQVTQFESLPVADLPPANYANNATAKVIGPTNAANFLRFFAKASVGVLTGAANVSLYLQASNASNGTFTNVSATNAVAFSNASNTSITVECRADQLPAGDVWVQAALLIQANSAFVQAELQCFTAHYKPASQFNSNTTILPQQIVY